MSKAHRGMSLTWLCVSATVHYCTIFAVLPPLSLSVPLWQAGMEEAVVYPGKLPIVSVGIPFGRERHGNKARHGAKKLTAKLLEQR